MIGAVLGLVFNLLHPRGDDYSAAGELELVASNDIWLFDHFMLAWSLAFAFVGLVAIGWSFPEGPAQGWGRIATATAIGGVTVAYVTLGVDGMAMAAVAPQNGWGTIGVWPAGRIVSVRAMPTGTSPSHAVMTRFAWRIMSAMMAASSIGRRSPRVEAR